MQDFTPIIQKSEALQGQLDATIDTLEDLLEKLTAYQAFLIKQLEELQK